MKILNSNSKNFDINWDSLLLQRKKKVQSNSVSVSSIIKDVRKNGDKALIKYEKRFNKNTIIVPSQKQIANSIKSLDKKVKQAIDIAYNRIYKFHSLQKFKNISYVDKYKNKLEYKYIPLESVAIYVPGSTASYPSSVLMNAIPAIVAGVKRIIMINPGFKGKQNPAVLYAARKCKIKEIYSIGGPSAIAAVAYGTKKINSICRFDFVDKVKSKNIDQKNEDLVLELIAIDYLKNKDDYEINLIFNNNAHIALTTETIEVRLEDQNEIKD